MYRKGATIDVEKVRKFAANATQLASAVESLKKSDGWQLFMALLEYRRIEIYERGDYEKLEDFKADRKALEIIDSIIGEFPKYLEDATGAQDLIKKLTEAENQTPISLVISEHEEEAKEA